LPYEQDEKLLPVQNLAQYTTAETYQEGRSKFTIALWILVQGLLVSSWIPGSWHRRSLLRLFGAKIGVGVVVKPRVRVKFPWKLEIGEYSWIGEDVWIDNLALVTIGTNACLSQGAYLCTGSHDWSLASFDLITKPIHVGDGAWIGARTLIAPGITVGSGAVLTAGSIATADLDSFAIYGGHPAERFKSRTRHVRNAEIE
jgi:putative colanic acid biosynthesis acetyltransferase WcaF